MERLLLVGKRLLLLLLGEAVATLHAVSTATTAAEAVSGAAAHCCGCRHRVHTEAAALLVRFRRERRVGPLTGVVKAGVVAASASASRRRRLAVDLHVFAEGARVGVALVTTSDFAVVWLVAGVDMRVLLAVRAVGKAAVTPFELTLERLLTCKIQKMKSQVNYAP